MFYLDLDEIDGLTKRFKLFSRNKFNIYAFRDSDHMRKGSRTLKENVIQYLNDNGINGVDKVYLLTQLRTWGFIFNPVSFYIATDSEGNTLAAVAEVANTFNEMKIFHIDARGKDETLIVRTPKYFYISPFSRPDIDLVISVKVPGERVDISVDDYQGTECLFKSRLSGSRRELTGLRMVGYTMRWPWITMQIVAGIHWQALKLWWKGVPFYRKAENQDMQRDYEEYLSKGGAANADFKIKEVKETAV